uniref:Uncharacterized protein n=1 Tax=Picea glauca TaxID=3330 RepID=A0A124GP63_PICGL|nr:hypothetical protein ABT39_MTgene849 [Picea glauca]
MIGEAGQSRYSIGNEPGRVTVRDKCCSLFSLTRRGKTTIFNFILFYFIFPQSSWVFSSSFFPSAAPRCVTRSGMSATIDLTPGWDELEIGSSAAGISTVQSDFRALVPSSIRCIRMKGRVR